MKAFEHTVTTEEPFEEAVVAIERKSAENGFRVLHTHDVAATLAEKGFPREPLKIIEICNAKYASQVLNKDVKISLMLPCPISVYVQEGKTEISTLLPSSIADFFPRAGIEGWRQRWRASSCESSKKHANQLPPCVATVLSLHGGRAEGVSTATWAFSAR